MAGGKGHGTFLDHRYSSGACIACFTKTKMKINYRGYSIGVIGMAKSGIAAANLARQLGARVLVSEMRPMAESVAAIAQLAAGIELEFEGHSARLLDADLIIKSPG